MRRRRRRLDNISQTIIMKKRREWNY
jgi:hypothetical protein